MADETVPKFYFYRTNEIVIVNGIEGVRGILEVGDTRYFTIERSKIGKSNAVKIPYGSFPLDMEYSPSDSTRKQFRIKNHQVYNNSGVYAALLIHLGNSPADVTGCIAPGKTMTAKGVEQSGAAMEEIFKAIGGFQVKRNAAILEVVPQFTYDVSKLKGVFIGNLSFK